MVAPCFTEGRARHIVNTSFSTQKPAAFTATTRKYIRPVRTPYHSRSLFLRWMLTLPYRSRRGAALIARYVPQTVPPVWAEELAGKRVLIVGSGPSLDKVGQEFFARFDTVIYINFAVKRLQGTGAEYFFTTDIGPVREFIDAYEETVFRQLGKEHCIFAPIYLDQFQMMTPAGRDLFSWLRFDEAQWRRQAVKLGRLKAPLVLRYHPRQPDWDSFTLPRGGRSLPVLDHTSALTAILFAAMNGAADIGLIGCDFSAGRAASAATTQAAPDASVFSGAAAEFRKLASALERNGVDVTNHSWLINDGAPS